MSAAHIKVERAVLKWPLAERLNLAERLPDSGHGFATEATDLAWRPEVARRLAEVESGKIKTIPSRTVFAEARKKLDGARKR